MKVVLLSYIWAFSVLEALGTHPRKQPLVAFAVKLHCTDERPVYICIDYKILMDWEFVKLEYYSIDKL